MYYQLNNKNKMKYNFLSPDGVTISMEHFDSTLKALEGFYIFLDRFKRQGYYSSKGERIPLHEVFSRCTLVDETLTPITAPQFMAYKGEEIFFEPIYKEFFVNDSQFYNLMDAKEYIKGGCRGINRSLIDF